MSQLPELSNVSSARGAPMGRQPFGEVPDQGDRLHLRRLTWVDGGYDMGGAYWGVGQTPEEHIFWLYNEDKDFDRFYRASSNAEAVALFRAEAKCSGHAIIFDSVEPSQDAKDFLATVLFTCTDPHEINEEPEDDAFFPNAHTASDFSGDFIAALETYLDGFRAYLDTLEPVQLADQDTSLPYAELLDSCQRSFGGNVYFSLSGHGCSFSLDEGEAGEKLQEALEAYTNGDTHRFEAIDLSCDSQGQVSLSLLPEYLSQGIRDLFLHI
jgi:hypothetical protein